MRKPIALFVMVMTGIVGCDQTDPRGASRSGMAPADAEKKLVKLLDKVRWTQNLVQRRANITLSQTNLMNTLPDIDEYPVVVEPGVNVPAVEIFVSTEKSGKDTDGWMRQAATEFNRQNIAVAGRPARIRIRKIASGTGFQFIASGKHVPQAYSPSNHLWVKMVAGHGVKTTPVMERTVGNVAGIVMKKSIVKQLKSTYNEVNVPNIIDAVVQGKLAMGYTNPYASSTGLNFLVSVLDAFGAKTGRNLLDPDVVSAFESFQRGVPFVAMTTLQMRDSVQNNGVLDAFVMEYQTFARTSPPMSSNYDFIPFGIRHDNPLYAIGGLNPYQTDVLKAFAELLSSRKFKKLADSYGFNELEDYKSTYEPPEPRLLLDAQKAWKDKKDAGRPIVAVFLADISGSMAGPRIRGLRKALIDGSDFISTNNSIGLVTFSNVVNVRLVPKKFDVIHKSAFYAAVEDLDTGGGTAMYDGILVSLSVLLDVKRAASNVKPMLFVLTDGQTNKGYIYDDVYKVIQGLGIPIYTIGYEAKLDELKRVSGLVEAATRDAGEGNISYTIGSLLNAQM